MVKGDVQDDEDGEKIQTKFAPVDLDKAKPKQIEVDCCIIFFCQLTTISVISLLKAIAEAMSNNREL